jgi:hypothetical protein
VAHDELKRGLAAPTADETIARIMAHAMTRLRTRHIRFNAAKLVCAAVGGSCGAVGAASADAPLAHRRPLLASAFCAYAAPYTPTPSNQAVICFFRLAGGQGVVRPLKWAAAATISALSPFAAPARRRQARASDARVG